MKTIREFWRRLLIAAATARYATRVDPWDMSGQVPYTNPRRPPRSAEKEEPT